MTSIAALPVAQAGEGWEIVGMVLAFYGPFWLVVAAIVVTVLALRHRRLMRAREQATGLLTQMLQQKLAPAEIERLLVAWSGDRRLAKQLMQFHRAELPPAKPAPPPLGP